ncbi:hypothetical protein [Streptomyces camelliae]|uniref:Lipoprotein n=1 Tax=Streptomyces camelliae TaxID=3004093 RepID=A0ABY7P2C2_9ACTN|nr:hypothetical protein [Streptomyces sp. HUAS 2-6]WBO63679.1 hypothetical protein O1G22_13000 [Streptomyces sp. HUAS 2-6]
MPTNTSRVSRRSRTLAVLAVATLGGGLLVSGPAHSAPSTGTVTYSGTVDCGTRFPNTVPTEVTLSAGNGPVADSVDNNGQASGSYGPVDLTAPVGKKFTLRVTVNCESPGGNTSTFHPNKAQSGRHDGDDVTLNFS